MAPLIPAIPFYRQEIQISFARRCACIHSSRAIGLKAMNEKPG